MSNRRFEWKKLLCMLLVCIFMMQLVSASVLAEVVSDIQELRKTADTVIATEIEEPVTIVGEVETERDESVKHYRLSDGLFAATQYAEPVHYKAADGQWRDMLGKIPHQCGGQAAFLNFCPWLVDPGEGEQVFTAPVLAVKLLQRPVGQQIHRRLKQVERITCGRRRNPKGIVLVAAVGVPDEVRADPSLVGVAGLAVRIHADEHHIVIGITLVKAAGLDAEVDQFIVDPSAVQIFYGVGGAAVDLRQKQHLFFWLFRSRDKSRRHR